MSKATSTILIPNDLASCQALIEQLASTIVEQSQKLDALAEAKQQLELKLAEMIQQAFRRRSERYIEHPDQLRFDFQNSPSAEDAAQGLADAVFQAKEVVVEEHRRRTGPAAQTGLPKNLERYVVEAPVEGEVSHCPSHGERVIIGYDEVETLEYQRPKLRVRVTRYAKFACRGKPDCGVSSPERAEGLVAGDRYDTTVAAEIITGKYAYHCPIYRKQDYFAGSGWTPSRSTLLNILSAAAGVISPLTEHMKRVLLAGDLIGTDDTSVTLILPPTIPKPIEGDLKSIRIHEVFSEAVAEGKPSVTARMWAYRGVLIPINVFDFTVSRHRDGPDAFLEGFCGKLMADCYSGYQGIALRSTGKIQRGACVSHARRKVFEARDNYPLESSLLLAWFQRIYDVEDRAKAMSAEERLALRQSESSAIWEEMRAWLDGADAARVLPKSQLGKALSYLRNHWDALCLSLGDGRMPIDNNEVEQLMKQVAIGRKNWIFVGSVAAGEQAAALLTLVSSAHRNDLDVWEYVNDVLGQLLAGCIDYDRLLPHVWKEDHPEAVRKYRNTDRRDRADRKQRRRAQRRSRR